MDYVTAGTVGRVASVVGDAMVDLLEAGQALGVEVRELAGVPRSKWITSGRLLQAGQSPDPEPGQVASDRATGQPEALSDLGARQS